MSGLRSQARVGLVVIVALLTITGMFAGTAAAGSLGTPDAVTTPADIPGNNGNADQTITADSTTLSYTGISTNQPDNSGPQAIKIDVSDLADAGVDISGAEIDTFSVDGDSSTAFSNFDAEAEEIQLVVDTGSSDSDFEITDLSLTGLDTSNVNTAQDLEYVVRVDEANAGDFDSNFQTDSIGTTDSFNIATIEVENLDSGDTVVETSISAAIEEANDQSADLQFSNNADEDTVVIRPNAGTYNFDTSDISTDTAIAADNTQIEPLNEGDEVVFENAGTDDTLDIDATGVEITGVTFDQGTTSQNALDVMSGADLSVTSSTFTNDDSGTPTYLSTVDDATVEVTGSTFEDGENNANGVVVTNNGDGESITLSDNEFTGLDTAINTNDDIDSGGALNEFSVTNNDFSENTVHVNDDDNAQVDLDTIFAENTFDQYAITENADGNIVVDSMIAGDLDEIAEATIDTAEHTTTVSAGEHTLTSGVTITADDVTITGAAEAAPEDVVVTPNDGLDPAIGLGTPANAPLSNPTISGITFDLSDGNSANSVIEDTDAGNVDGLTISDNRFINADQSAATLDKGEERLIELRESQDTAGTHSGLQITDNEFDSADGGAYQAIGVQSLAGTETIQISDNTINATGNSGDIVAIRLQNIGDEDDNDAVDVEVTDNTITNMEGGVGIWAEPVDDGEVTSVTSVESVTISGNTIASLESSNTGAGVVVPRSADTLGNVITIDSNDISGFVGTGSSAGIAVDAADATIQNNQLSNNDVHFTELQGSAYGSNNDDNYDEQTIIDDNTVSPVVLTLDEEGGDIVNDAVFGTVEGGVTEANDEANGDFIDVGAGTYEEDQIAITASDITLSTDDSATLTTETTNSIISQTDNAEITGFTFATSEADPGSADDITVDGDATISDNEFVGSEDRTAIDVSGSHTVDIQDSEISGYGTGVYVNDGSAVVNVVRNQLTENDLAVDVDNANGEDDVNVNFNDIVDNEVGIENDAGTAQTAVANWWGDASGPSGDAFAGDGDEVAGANSVTVDPWLTESQTALPTDQYVVIPDPIAPTADGNADANVVVATLNDTLADGEDETSTVLLSDPASPITNTKGSGEASAANPIDFTLKSTEAGDYTLTAQNTNDNIPTGSATQTFVGEASNVEVSVDSDTLVADDQSTINATATLVDDNGNPVDRTTDYGVTWLVSGSNDASVTRVTEEDFDTSTPNTQARLELSAENAGVDLTITAQADTGGYAGSASATTVEPAAANFTVDFVEGPTTITQNESFSATVNVTNEGDAAGTQDITYDLEDSAGISQVSVTEEDVQLNASASQEVTFEVAASNTESLSTGDFTHVFSSNDDELTLDVTVQAADEPGQVALENTTLDPSSVSANTTNDHNLTFDAVNVSDDGNTDSFTVTIPSAATLESANSVSVVDANGTDVSLSGGPDVSGNEITFDVAPDSSADTRTLSVTANVTVAAPDVENETTADITVDVSDSNNGQDSADVTLTVAPADADPEDPVDRFDTNGEPGIQSGEVLNAISAFNEDTRIGGEPVESRDVLDVISAFNEA